MEESSAVIFLFVPPRRNPTLYVSRLLIVASGIEQQVYGAWDLKNFLTILSILRGQALCIHYTASALARKLSRTKRAAVIGPAELNTYLLVSHTFFPLISLEKAESWRQLVNHSNYTFCRSTSPISIICRRPWNKIIAAAPARIDALT